MVIDRPNQVWAADITYVPIGRSFISGGDHRLGEPCGAGLAPVEHDGHIVLRVCALAARRGLARLDRPEIFNTDQGSQLTSAALTGTLAATGVRISMDGGGRWMDNVFIERLWRLLKYEDIYLKSYSDGHEAKAGIARWIEFYNFRRPIRHCKTALRWRSGGAEAIGAFGEEAVDMTLLASEKLRQRCALPTATTAASKGSVKYWAERTAAAPLKKPDPVVLSVGSISQAPDVVLPQSGLISISAAL
ncbi:hypothetical protein AOQ73_24420 [Bradyrhizobium pachyrhizi]|nr:hypothetical protein AOQ73_24420 [Bradyrhizobium pachyrhizi]